jgi:tyrosine-protein kinase Etk/Wzc
MLFILQTLIQWRRFIVIAGFLTAVVTAGVTLLLPKWYTASSSVFPPETNQFGSMSSYTQMMQSLQMPILGPTASGLTPSTIYIDILKSRRVGERLLDEFDLKTVWKSELTSDALEILHKHTFYSLVDNGLLTISYEDKDPERAAAVTNRYVDLLDEFNQELNVTRAGKTREFISRQMELHATDLRDAEEALREFQEENKTLELTTQVGMAIEVVSSLTADAIALEVDLELLREYASVNSQEYIRKKKKYDEILQQLRTFETDSARSEGDVVRSYFPTFDAVPELKLELARLTRRVMVEEKVHALLIEEYEKSSIEEARDTPTVQVLDRADVPELKSRPKRAMITLIGGVAGVAWSSFLAIFVTVWREDSGRGSSLRRVIQPVLSDFGRPFRRKRKE